MNSGTAPLEPRLDAFVKRLNIYSAAAISACALFALAGALASRAVERMTRTVRTEIRETRSEVAALRISRAHEQRLDSLRFERTITIVELAVSALVEPSGSPERRSAIAELRRKRHVTPRNLEE